MHVLIKKVDQLFWYYALAGKQTLSGRDRALLARVERNRGAQGAGQALERRFGNMMRIFAI